MPWSACPGRHTPGGGGRTVPPWKTGLFQASGAFGAGQVPLSACPLVPPPGGSRVLSAREYLPRQAAPPEGRFGTAINYSLINRREG